MIGSAIVRRKYWIRCKIVMTAIASSNSLCGWVESQTYRRQTLFSHLKGQGCYCSAVVITAPQSGARWLVIYHSSERISVIFVCGYARCHKIVE